MSRPFNVLIHIDNAYAFDRRAFEGIATLANELGDVRLTRKLYFSAWTDLIFTLQIDGVISTRLEQNAIAELVAVGVPYVCLADLPCDAPNQYVVAVDDKAVGIMAARHFLDSGFEHFAAICHPKVRSYFSKRLTAFVDEVTAAGYPCSFGPPEIAMTSRNSSVTDDNIWDVRVEAWLKQQKTPLAIFAPYDYYAQIAVNASRS